jgi:PKD repeat protein
LLLGTLVVALSVYQVTSVPGQNRNVEFDHNREVQSQLQGVRNAILETAATGEGRSASVSLGAQYSNRVFAVNPAPPSGTLRTVDPSSSPTERVTLRNVIATNETGETAHYWNGSRHAVPSRELVYEPNYNEYRNAPTTIYGHTLLANQFGGANRSLTDQTLIDGNRINLVTLNGLYSESQPGTVSVDMRPVSVSSNTVPVTNEGDPIELLLPTEMNLSVWQEALAGEMTTNGTEDGHVQWVRSNGRNLISIGLEGGVPYDLRMLRIGVGTDIRETSPAYLTDISGDDATVPENGTRSLVVEVRDPFNNPVSNETVNFTVADSPAGPTGTLSTVGTAGSASETVRVTTDENGRAEVAYAAPADIDGARLREVEVRTSRTVEPSSSPSVNFSGSTVNNVTFNLEAVNSNANRPPSASFTSSPANPNASEDVTFDASGSNDSDGEIVRYGWAFGDGTTITTSLPVTDHTYGDDGSYDVTLTAIDGDGGRSTTTETIAVSNHPPTVAIDYNPFAPEADETVVFDGTGSSDPDGTVDSYEWDFGDGTTGTGETPSHTYGDDGVYTVTLTATDDDGTSYTTNENVSVSNQEPIADFGYLPQYPVRGESVRFNGSASADRDGSITSYEWDFGDGTTGTGETPSHTYGDDGVYTVTLTVTDDDGATTTTGPRSVTIDDREPASTNRWPTAAFEVDPSEPRTGDRIEFDASGSSDPDGDGLDYRWKLTYPNGRTETTSGETVTADPLFPGEYRMTLTVDDGDATNSTNETFSVTPGRPNQGAGSRSEAATVIGTDPRGDGDPTARYADQRRTVLRPSLSARSR